jgi:hypothetical protein
MDLTKQERKFAELSARRYNRFFYRKSQLFGWVGVVLFTFGLMRLFQLPGPAWLSRLFLLAGFSLIILSSLAFAMTIIGKLYGKDQQSR